MAKSIEMQVSEQRKSPKDSSQERSFVLLCSFANLRNPFRRKDFLNSARGLAASIKYLFGSQIKFTTGFQETVLQRNFMNLTN